MWLALQAEHDLWQTRKSGKVKGLKWSKAA